MCFKHLPIEFDEEGNARIKPGAYTSEPRPTIQIEDPKNEDKLRELLARNGHIPAHAVPKEPENASNV